MEQYTSFGTWVQLRRKLLGMTQADLASKVSCSLSMLRKIEREERRPSDQLAGLLGRHLSVDRSELDIFLKMARGLYVSRIPNPTDFGYPTELSRIEAGQQDRELVPFVARERELEQLQIHLSQAANGRGRIVFISGEAGRGKTTLLSEFARRAMLNRSDLLVAGGSSDVYIGSGDPLLPFRDIYRLLTGDFNSAGMGDILTFELAKRLWTALPETTEVLLDHGPHLIETLLSGEALEQRLTEALSRQSDYEGVLVRLRNQRAISSSVSVQDLKRDRLFDEISSTLTSLARRQPLLLMLDDLHWADSSTTALLGHLVMRLQRDPILIIGSFRPEDLAQGGGMDDQGETFAHPLVDLLNESQRQFGDNRLDLDHPSPKEELEFVNALLDADDNAFSAVFRRRIARMTEGHPLFVVELLREMKDRGDVIRGADSRWRDSESMSWENVPARVEGVIEKRITRLPAELRELLTAGSVQGETFFAEVIGKIGGADIRTLTRQLNAELDRRHRLIRGQGITRTGSVRLTVYQFRHHLYQKYLYGRLSAAERMYLHEGVGTALEELYKESGSEAGLLAAQLARQFQEAHLAVKASRYLLLAGQNAARMLAYDEAAAHLLKGLELLADDIRSPETELLEFDLIIALARAYWHGGHLQESLATFERSIVLARDLDDPAKFAQAVLAYEEPRWRLNLVPETSQTQLREALSRLDTEDEKHSGLRVRLLVGLARSLLTAGKQEGLKSTVDQALLVARQINDPVALCDALRISAQIDRSPETTGARLAAVEEMMTTARAIGDYERLSDAIDLYIYDQLELGHIELVDKMIAAQKQAAEEINQSFQLHIAAVFQTMRAIMKGEFDKAEQLANEAAEISQQIGLTGVDGIWGTHMFTIRWEQGRLDEIAPILKIYIANSPDASSWRPGLALVYRILDKREECRALFELLVSKKATIVPQDSLHVATLAYLTEVCVYLEDVDRAAALYEQLQPYGGRAVVVGGATVCYGAAGRYLGMLAKTMGDWPSAERHFVGALQLDKRMKSWAWYAHSQLEYASMLLCRGRADDSGKALLLLDEASAAADEMGMNYLSEKITALRERYALAQD